jgi:hypothetical protein
MPRVGASSVFLRSSAFVTRLSLLVAAAQACILVSGCSASPVIRGDVVDYSDVIEQSTDEFLLRNILEARDDAPIHFVELPKINGALQATAGLSTVFPYYARTVGGGTGIVNATVTPSITVQSSPSFEVDSLASKQFSTGVSSQISPSALKYWYDRGLDRRLLLLLFFSSARISESCTQPSGDSRSRTPPHCHSGAVTVRNDPREAVDVMNWRSPDGRTHITHETEFGLYLQIVNGINGKFIIHDYTEKTEVAEHVRLAPTAIASFNPKQYELELVKPGRRKSLYDIYTAGVQHKIALCIRWSPNSTRPVRTSGTSPAVTEACSRREVIIGPKVKPTDTPAVPEILASDSDLPKSCKDSIRPYCGIVEDLLGALKGNSQPKGMHLTLALTPRSAAGLVRFLGDLLYYQDHLIADRRHNNPVTLSYLPGAPDDVLKEGGWIFRVNGRGETPRFSLRYRGETYTIAQSDRRDHSLEVLAIVNQVINLNKSAQSLLTTPTVRVIP